MNSKGAAQLGRSRSTLIRRTGPGRGVPWSSKWDLECPRNQMQGAESWQVTARGSGLLRMAPAGLGLTPALTVWRTGSSDKPLPLSTPQFSHPHNGFRDFSLYLG